MKKTTLFIRNKIGYTNNFRYVKSKMSIFFVFFIGFIFGLIFKNFIPVATVGNIIVTRHEFLTRLIKSSGEKVLQEIAIEKLVFNEASKRNISISKEEIEKQKKIIESELILNGSDLASYLYSQGYTKDSFEKELKLQLMIKKMIPISKAVSEDEINNYMLRHSIQKGEGAIYESQKIAVRQAIISERLRLEFKRWIALKMGNFKINYFLPI